MTNKFSHIDPETNRFNEILNEHSSSKYNFEVYSVFQHTKPSSKLSNELLILNYNVRNFARHIDELATLFSCAEPFPDIIASTETWCSDGYAEDIPG